jgi:hypothetical protein
MGESGASAGVMQPWLSSALFHSYVRRFTLLWVVGKIANAVTAAFVKLPPLAFRPGTEVVVLAFELTVLLAFIRRANEDILLGNLGLRLSVALAPLVLVHLALSLALSLLT